MHAWGVGELKMHRRLQYSLRVNDGSHQLKGNDDIASGASSLAEARRSTTSADSFPFLQASVHALETKQERNL